MIIYLFIVVLAVFIMNYAMVTQQSSCKQHIDDLREAKELDETLNVYFSEPDVFKQYYLENNYGSLSEVTSAMFDDPTMRIL